MNRIAFIGLGTMGAPMVRNLSTKGFPVFAYNRSQRDIDIGDANRAQSMREAVEGADVVILMVSDGNAVQSVLFGDDGASRYMNDGTLVVNMSTIGVDETKQLALELADIGMEWMDAPVSGSQKPAENAELVILAGGSDNAFDRMKPLFLAMGKSAHHLGPIGSGAAMKLIVNAYLAMTVGAVSECMAVVDKAGLDKQSLLNVLSETAMWSPMLAAKQPLWLSGEFPPAFALKHMTKDVGLMSHYAVQLSASTPLILAALGEYLGAQADDLAEYDMAAVYRHIARVAGVDHA